MLPKGYALPIALEAYQILLLLSWTICQKLFQASTVPILLLLHATLQCVPYCIVYQKLESCCTSNQFWQHMQLKHHMYDKDIDTPFHEMFASCKNDPPLQRHQ
jgi:hypothetical protein